jgi:hypothetical protein
MLPPPLALPVGPPPLPIIEPKPNLLNQSSISLSQKLICFSPGSKILCKVVKK